MTPLKKPVSRRMLQPIDHRGRRLVVTLQPAGIISLREERTRTVYELPLAHVYSMAVKAEVLRKRAERAQARKGRPS